MFLSKNSFFNDPFEMYPSRDDEIMRADVYEKENICYIKLDIPGVNKENINISYDQGYLHVAVIKKEEMDVIDNYIRKERYYGEFQRSFYVGNINDSNIKATYKDGILCVIFPKEEPRESRRQISIE